MALASGVGLEQDQIAFIEEAIDAGSMSIRKPIEASAFSASFNDIIERLRASQISLAQLAARTGNPLTGESGVIPQVFSAWKHGRARPTLVNVRALAVGLRNCKDQRGGRLISENEIRLLIETAGFTAHEFTDTSHDVIERINETSHIKPLLRAIRNAADISIPSAALPFGSTGGMHLTAGMVESWESDNAPYYPTGEQARALLQTYNAILRKKAHPPLTDPEIDLVSVVAERDRARWQALPPSQRRPGSTQQGRRQLPSPDLNNGPAR
jgi:hypothetical protein